MGGKSNLKVCSGCQHEASAHNAIELQMFSFKSLPSLSLSVARVSHKTANSGNVLIFSHCFQTQQLHVEVELYNIKNKNAKITFIFMWFPDVVKATPYSEVWSYLEQLSLIYVFCVVFEGKYIFPTCCDETTKRCT